MSRFPKITETFVLNEILQQENLGNHVEVYPLLREPETVVHPAVEQIMPRAHFQPFLSFAILYANWHFLRSRPMAYLKMIAEVLRGSFGNLNFFVGALVFLPKSVWFAYHMQRQGIRHIHAHFATHPAVAALIIHRLTGIPFSFTAHGHDVHIDLRMLKQKVEAAAFAVTVSRYNQELIVRHCGEPTRDKIHVVHCGVDTDLFRSRVAVRSPGPLRIVSVASLSEVKGHKYLIDACAKLRQRGVAFECHLIGEGPLRRELEKQVSELHLGDSVRLHGARPQPWVLQAISTADVFVLASVPTASGLREGIPVALMEAMSCGLPVISSRLSGIPELVDHGTSGLLVTPRDSKALADALFFLDHSPDIRAQFGAAARQKVQYEFDLFSNNVRLSELFAAHARPVESPASSSVCSLDTTSVLS